MVRTARHSAAGPGESLRSAAFALCLSVTVFGCSAPVDSTVQIEGPTMGTTYRVTYAPAADSESTVPNTVDSLLDEIDRSLSTYIESSVISRINSASDTERWHAADRHFNAVFVRSQEIFTDTGGAFNPAVGPLVNAWGFGPQGPQSVPDAATIDSLMELTDFDAFDWRESPPSVRKPMEDSQLDFSAIAKGYGVDEAGALLDRMGVDAYFVEIGGEVRTRGRHPDGRPWRVGIEIPAAFPNPERSSQAVIEVQDTALATSGNYRNFTIVEGRRIAHILDPETGAPATTSLLSVSVLAPDVMTADAYATALMVMDLDAGLRFVEAREELEAYFIVDDGDGGTVATASSGFPPILDE